MKKKGLKTTFIWKLTNRNRYIKQMSYINTILKTFIRMDNEKCVNYIYEILLEILTIKGLFGYNSFYFNKADLNILSILVFEPKTFLA